MAQHKPKKGTYRVKGNTGQPMDFSTRKRAKNVARQIQGGKVKKNGVGCLAWAVAPLVGVVIAASTTAVSHYL